jgi:hypothetical protein
MKNINLDTKFAAITIFILAAALFRFLPHAPNFTPLMAIALFGGAMFSNKKIAFIIPFAAMLISDIFLGFHSAIIAVYVSFAILVYFGIIISKKKSLISITLTSVSGAVIFFILSNFAVWLTFGIYSKDLAGLIACYEAAIPFFRNTLFSSLLFSYVLFGGYALTERFVPKLQKVKIEN